jgi:hypothetical protein
MTNLMKSILVGLVAGVFLFLALSAAPAEACACSGPVGGGHPYYTTEEINAIHSGVTERVMVTIREDDGDVWIYTKDETTGGYYKALN